MELPRPSTCLPGRLFERHIFQLNAYSTRKKLIPRLPTGNLFRLLDEALLHASEEKWDLEKPEFRLMALTRAFAAYFHKGVCEPSVMEIARAQAWLKDADVTEYTDIQMCIQDSNA